ncbi:hypothetical protein EBT16_11270, partial [bacterium]|nr:hypothetical protein [bacterium]
MRWVFGQPQTETTVKKFTCHDGSSVELRLTTRIHGDGSEDNQAINYFLCDLQDLASLIDVKFATVRELRAAIDEHPRAHSILASRVAHSLMIQSSKVRTPKDLRNDIKVRLNEGPIAGVAEVKELWEADKIASDLANSKGEMYKRKYSVRTKYLVYMLTKENKRAHKIPMVLTLKGLNGTDVSEKVKLYEKEMSKCLSKALDSEIPLAFNEKF